MRIILNLSFITLFCFISNSLMAQSNDHHAAIKTSAVKLIAAMNSNNYQTNLTFAKESILPSRLQQIGGAAFYADYLSAESFFHGTLTFQSAKVISAENEQVEGDVLVLSSNTQLVYRLELTVTESVPNKLIRLRFRVQEDTTESKLSTKQAVASLSKYIDQLSELDVFSGSVLVAKNDTLLLEKSTGFASKRFDVLNNKDTRFNLGSMNKMFTAVTILKLVEDGKLELTTPLHKIFDLEGKAKFFNDIQIQHLLSHSAGVGSIQCEMGESSLTKSKQDCLTQLSQIDVNFKPGTNFRYSNDGMFILGLVIEHISQLSYYQMLNESVFIPADMSNSACLDLQYPVPNAAIGYYYHGEKQSWRNNLFIHDKKGSAAGGCYATARDLFNFSNALLSNQLLNSKLTQLALTGKQEMGSENYGFGFIIDERNGEKVVGHNGAFPGVSSQMNIHLESGYRIIVLSNHSFAARPIVAKFNQLFLN